MMNTPSMHSVEQLLKARQDGVPDYVVVPMLQKAMAQKQAMAQQQALQQGAPKPPVAQQILDAAQHAVMSDHLARKSREEIPVPSREEAKGIDALPSGIDEEDYAHGGIIAFANGTDEEGVRTNEDDLITLPDIVSRHNNLLGQSKNDVPKDYADVTANVLDGKDLLARNYSQFDNPDDVVTKWRGKGAKNLPIYKENVRNWLKESGWKEGDKLNLKDDRDLNRMVAAIANQEMSANLKPEHISAIESGRYKFADGTPAKVNQRAPQQESTQNPTGGIASLAYPSAPEEQAQPYSQDETTPEYEGKRLQDYLGEDPNAARREARLSKREADLAEEKDRSPWMALMQAGLSTMAGTSPNAFANIGAGATEGLKAYGEARKDLSKSQDKLMDLRGEVEDAQYAHEQAIKTHGWDSAEAKKKANMLIAKENQKAKWDYKKDAAEFGLKKFEAENKGNLQSAEANYYESGRNRNNQDVLAAKSDALKAKQLADISRTVNDEVKQFAKQQDPKTLTLPSQEQLDNYRASREKYHMERYGISSPSTEVAPQVNVGNPNYNVKNYFK